MRKKAKKQKFICQDGPFRGSVFYLESGSTLPITFKCYKGRYISSGYQTLMWEPA